ncbi:IclR family transcriptional regulator [Brachybacterium vulturis]|uniref:Glycerol operon regulatory protein n=1 Tax=Brachybacterium vulturis TaxID=2017484 RepID=A0A291GR91_9MICO|nr:IclR family transcriptional regulator [Brachybacterium vulturis]ATG52745.1 IclR family transcriptional regulator [Brachybacterium vulturis]
MATKQSAGGVQSVERAFHLLEVIAAADGEISLSALAQSVDLPLPTIHRLLRTLVTPGYVRQLPNRAYVLGPRLIWLGESATRQLGPTGRPVLQRLADELGESANMAALDGQMIVYVGQVQSSRSMRMFTEVGRRAYPHATGVGKAILAGMPDSEVEKIVRATGMPQPTPKSAATFDELLERLEVVRAQGYAIDEEEQELGVRCYSMAVPGEHSRIAISVSGPSSRVDAAFGERAVPLLRAAAAQLSREMRLDQNVNA